MKVEHRTEVGEPGRRIEDVVQAGPAGVRHRREVIARKPELGPVFVDHDDPIRVRERQPLEQDGIDQTEDGGGATDADRQREDGGCGKDWRSRQRSQRVAESRRRSSIHRNERASRCCSLV